MPPHNMTTFRQYLRRAVRSGYAYAEIGLRLAGRKEKLWLRELVRIVVNAAGPAIILVCSLLAGSPVAGLILGAILALRPLFKVFRFARQFHITLAIAILYALHLSFVVYPQFFGVLRYLLGVMQGRPLRNKGYAAETASP